jgi:hypothetical protein
MKRHYLHNIDLEARTALCSACGVTEIYIPMTRARAKPKVYCVERARELREIHQANQNRIRAELRAQPGWKPRHSLAEIDTEGLSAVCTICGPTDVRKSVGRKYTRYTCATYQRQFLRKYRRSHYIARSSNPHALSEINEEKWTAVCAKCGPVKIEIWLGKKKINRRCINVRTELNQAKAKESLSKMEA